MGPIVRSTAFFVLCLLAGTGAAQADERWDSARDHARSGRKDFAFLEYKAFLRENPASPRARDAEFALGEYCFERNDAEGARRAFSASATGPADEFALLSEVYLLQCARRLDDAGAARELEERLKKSLSSRRFFRLFEGRKPEKWTSPLGNDFRFRESADRLEIELNGSPFYAIVLP
ncbi:MAG TPA: hypothetical protein VL404_07570 [Candidatus Eisenbacteria bacterium]|jgi:hypothetical protein|nr:hypothetical protein [Candidatus Eisenbacteria bacterium]